MDLQVVAGCMESNREKEGGRIVSEARNPTILNLKSRLRIFSFVCPTNNNIIMGMKAAARIVVLCAVHLVFIIMLMGSKNPGSRFLVRPTLIICTFWASVANVDPIFWRFYNKRNTCCCCLLLISVSCLPEGVPEFEICV